MDNDIKIISLGALLFMIVLCLGFFYLGRKSVRVPEPIETVKHDTVWLDLPPVHDTLRVPGPERVIPADTVYYPVPQAVDTAALHAAWLDYYATREYCLDFSSDTLGVFVVDATVTQNKIQEAVSTVKPKIKVITTTQTFYKVKPIQPWVMAGTSTDFKFQQFQAGVDLNDKYMIGVSGVRYDRNFAFAINGGIKF